MTQPSASRPQAGQHSKSCVELLVEAEERIAQLEAELEQYDRWLRAWLIDRAEQYANTSGYRAAIEDLSDEVRRGCHRDAATSGELDDILERLR